MPLVSMCNYENKYNKKIFYNWLLSTTPNNTILRNNFKIQPDDMIGLSGGRHPLFCSTMNVKDRIERYLVAG